MMNANKKTNNNFYFRSLPEDQSHETGLEGVIHEVADFIKPTGGNNRGVYKLKPHLYEEYDTFFYHYTREELSRSEEEQRNRRKGAGKLRVWRKVDLCVHSSTRLRMLLKRPSSNCVS